MKHKYVLAMMEMAEVFSKTSCASRLKVGALIYKNDSIISLGINGQPSGWYTEKCEDSDGKTLPTVRHAEAAALEKMYLSTETTEGAEMFTTHEPCLSCAIKISSAKISKVYYKHPYGDSGDGLMWLKQAGVVVYKVDE